MLYRISGTKIYRAEWENEKGLIRETTGQRFLVWMGYIPIICLIHQIQFLGSIVQNGEDGKGLELNWNDCSTGSILRAIYSKNPDILF